MTITEWLTIMVIVAIFELLWLTTETAWRALERALDADMSRRVGAAGQAAAARGPGRHHAGSLPAPTRTRTRPGAGPQPRTVALSPDTSGEAAPPDGSDGPGHQQPVGDGCPRHLSPAGPTPHPRGEGVAATGPDLVAATRGAA